MLTALSGSSPSPRLAVAFYSPVVIALNVAAFLNDPRPMCIAPVLALAGLGAWGLFEYAIHRFVLHAPRALFGRVLSITALHSEHHCNPLSLQTLCNPIKRSLPVAATYALAARAMSGSWLDAAYLLGGFTTGYLYYEWLHAEVHHGGPRFQPFRKARKYHLQHHYADPMARFGVTSPVFDLVFGTFRSSRCRHSSGPST